MSKKYERTRPRLLVICKNQQARNDLVTLLTGYGYYVDYVDSRAAGVLNYRAHKQAIIIMDVPALPQYPERMFKLFSMYRRNPVILIAAQINEEAAVYPYMQQGVYDIVQLPLKPGYQHYILRRLVEHSSLMAQNEFMKYMLSLGLLGIPVCVAALILLL